MLLTQGALRAGELCQATGYSPNSITAALRLLAQLELIAKTPDGWRVPPDIRSALLAGAAENFANREAPASICESSLLGGEVKTQTLLLNTLLLQNCPSFSDPDRQLLPDCN